MVVVGNNYDVVMCFRLVASSFVYCLWKVSESPTYLYLSITSRPSYVVICFLPASLPVAYVCEMSKSHESVSVHLYLLFQCGNIFFFCLLSSIYCLWKIEIICTCISLPVSQCSNMFFPAYFLLLFTVS